MNRKKQIELANILKGIETKYMESNQEIDDDRGSHLRLLENILGHYDDEFDIAHLIRDTAKFLVTLTELQNTILDFREKEHIEELTKKWKEARNNDIDPAGGYGLHSHQ